MPIISIDATFFWQIINFFVLLFIVKKYFKEPISKIINERKQKIEAELVEATKNREEAEKLHKKLKLKFLIQEKKLVKLFKMHKEKQKKKHTF